MKKITVLTFLLMGTAGFAQTIRLGGTNGVLLSASNGTVYSGTTPMLAATGNAARLSGTAPAMVSGSAFQSGTAGFAAASGTASYAVTSGTAAGVTVGRKMVVFEGDSITAWGTWPALLLTGSAGRAFAQCSGTMVATPGDTLAGITAEYASQVQPFEPNTTGTAGILFVRIGTNDLSQAHFASYSSAAAYVTGTGTSLQTYWRRAQAGGYKVVGFTVNDFSGNDNDAMRRQVNRLIRDAAAQNNVALIDTDALIPDHSTNYFGDGTHPTMLQDQVVARYINNYFSGNGWSVWPSSSDYATRIDANLALNGTTSFNAPFSQLGGIDLSGSAQNTPQAVFHGPITVGSNWVPINIGSINQATNNVGLTFGNNYKLEITGSQGTQFDDPASFQKGLAITGSGGLRVLGGQDGGLTYYQNNIQAVFDGPIETNATWGGPVTIGVINGNNNLGFNFGSSYALEFTGTNGVIFDPRVTFLGGIYGSATGLTGTAGALTSGTANVALSGTGGAFGSAAFTGAGAYLKADPMSSGTFALRLQTHAYGSNVPVGLYKDVACTQPATVAGDVVKAWRDDLATGTVVMSNSNSAATLQFVSGEPVVHLPGGSSTANNFLTTSGTYPLAQLDAWVRYRLRDSSNGGGAYLVSMSAGTSYDFGTNNSLNWNTQDSPAGGSTNRGPQAAMVTEHLALRSGTATLYANGVAVATVSSGAVTGTATLLATSGRWYPAPSISSGSFSAPVDLAAIVIGQGASAAQMATVDNALTPNIETTKVPLVQTGDSITQGFNSNLNVAPVDDYPDQLQLLRPRSYVVNDGGWGNTISNLAGRAAFTDSLIARSGTLTVEIGSNDLAAGTSGSACEVALWSYIDARKAANPYASIYVCTVLPRDNSSISAAAFEAAREDFNGRIRANYAAHANGVIDIGAAAGIGWDGVTGSNPADATVCYNADRTHPNAAGMRLLAAAVNNALPGRVFDPAAGQPATLSALTVGGVSGGGVSISRVRHGLATLAGGTVAVSDANTTAATRIYLTAQDTNSTGALRVSARTAGTGFTITSSNGADSGVVAWEEVEP